MHPFSTALELSHVSRHFRLIAHNTSELWTFICPKFPLAYDQVTFWLDVLARSGVRPLDIAIEVRLKHLGAMEPYEIFLRAMVEYSDRWRKLEITSRTWELIDLFLRRSQHLALLPQLEELTLYHTEDPGRTTNREEEDLTPRFHNVLFGRDTFAPKLYTIKLGATYFDHSRMWSLANNLVELHFGNHTYPPSSDVPQRIVDLLRESPNLQVLTLTSMNVQLTNLPAPVELSRLRRLEYRGFPHVAMQLLSLLRVPALEVLDLGECSFAASPDLYYAMPPIFVANQTLRILVSLFTNSANRQYWRAGGLKELSLEYNRCLEREAKRFLRLTRNVDTLHVSCSAILSVLANNPEILPNLRHSVVKSSIFCDNRPFSTILKNRPGLTLSVEGNLTPVLYDALEDTTRDI